MCTIGISHFSLAIFPFLILSAQSLHFQLNQTLSRYDFKHDLWHILTKKQVYEHDYDNSLAAYNIQGKTAVIALSNAIVKAIE